MPTENKSGKKSKNISKRLLNSVYRKDFLKRFLSFSNGLLILFIGAAMIAVAAGVVVLKIQHADYKESEEAAYNTIKNMEDPRMIDYEDYMLKFKGGKHYDEISRKYKRMKYQLEDWTLASERNTVDAYLLFLDHYPNSEWSKEARGRADSLFYQQILKEPRGALMQKYMDIFPKGAHYEEVLNMYDSRRSEYLQKVAVNYLNKNFYSHPFSPKVTLKLKEGNSYIGTAPHRGDTLMHFSMVFDKALHVISFKVLDKFVQGGTSSAASSSAATGTSQSATSTPAEQPAEQ